MVYFTHKLDFPSPLSMADKEMKTAVLEALKESETRTLSIKQLRKIVIGTPFSENASKAIWI